MMKSDILTAIGAVLVVLALATQAASASHFDASIQDPEVSSCPTVMKGEKPLNSDDISVLVTNTGASAEAFSLRLEGPDGWPAGFIQPSLLVEPGKTAKVSTLWVTVPDVPPGEHTLNVLVGSGEESKAVPVSISVLRCRAVELEIADDSKSVCSENPEAVTYDVKVTNKGRDKETFALAASAGWAGLSKNEVTLEPDASESVTLTADPTEVAGVQEIEVTARSLSSYASEKKSVKLEGENCYDFSAVLSPVENSACIEKGASFMVKLENTGTRKDTYAIVLPEGVSAEDSEITLPSGDMKEMPVSVRPEKSGKMLFEITVKSSNEEGLIKTLSGFIEGLECRDVALVMPKPEKDTICSGEELEIPVIIKNQGQAEETFVLSATTSGTFEKTIIKLAPQETETVALRVGTGGLLGAQSISAEVKIEGTDIGDSDSTEITVENCYSAELSVSPEELSVCIPDNAVYSISVRNTGKYADTYTVRMGNSVKEFSLDSGDVISVDLDVELQDAGEQVFSAQLTSENGATASAGATLVAKPRESCYSASLAPVLAANINLKPREAGAIAVKLKNTGESRETFEITLDGPEWVQYSPERASLDAGGETEVYLYASPPVGIEEGRYAATIKAESKNAKAESGISVNIGENFFVSNEGKAMADAQSDGFLGRITGAFVNLNDLPIKTLALIGIVAIIVIILAVRMMLYFR
ncbi:MAG: hypothetical protein HY518_00735 [Candidatus Aenigmarchaeota archaeon]|nr:hypothetical protein [Candidatus Aenigmarchaeota archaeon]